MWQGIHHPAAGRRRARLQAQQYLLRSHALSTHHSLGGGEPSSRTASSPGWLRHMLWRIRSVQDSPVADCSLLVTQQGNRSVPSPGSPELSHVFLYCLFTGLAVLLQLQLGKHHECLSVWQRSFHHRQTYIFENLRELESPPPIRHLKLLQKRTRERKEGRKKKRESFLNSTSYTPVSTFLWTRDGNESAEDHDDPCQGKELR